MSIILSPNTQFLYPNISAIPEALKALPQWVCWRAVERGGRVTKIPFTTAGTPASSTDPGTWGNFATVWDAFSNGGFSGVGFVFRKGGELVGIDLDDVFDAEGKLQPKARRIIERFNSYTELSPSGRGVHIICCGHLEKGVRHGPIEVYPHERYFTVTGSVFDGYERIEAAQFAIDWLLKRIRHKSKKPQRWRTAPPRFDNDNELLRRAMSARNGTKFSRLWNGDTSGYPSPSEADLGLLSLLLYWTSGDESRSIGLFRQSGLYRPKTDRPDYLPRCFARLRGGGA